MSNLSLVSLDSTSETMPAWLDEEPGSFVLRSESSEEEAWSTSSQDEFDDEEPLRSLHGDYERTISPRPVFTDDASADSFGIDPEKLAEARAAMKNTFTIWYQHARRRQNAKADSKNYEAKQRPYTKTDGETGMETQLLRIEPTRAERLQASNSKAGKQAAAGTNRAKVLMRNLTGTRRRYGSNYASDKGTEGLLNNKKLEPVVFASGMLTEGKIDTSIVGAAGVHTSAIGGALGFASVPASIADTLDVLDTYTGLLSSKAQAKASLRHCEDARRFMLYLENATPEEAQNYLVFCQAAQKLLGRTREVRATHAAVKTDAAKGGVVQPVSTTASTSVQIANLVVGSPAVGYASAALAPLAIASAGLDIHLSKQEQARRQAQRESAIERKEAMAEVLRSCAGHPRYALLAGIVAGLNAQQDRLIRQAKVEYAFAKAREIKSATSVPLSVAGAVTTALVAGGVATAATGGAVAAVVAVPALVMAALLTVRARRRARAEHTSKWRQRGVCALAFHMPRKVLEQKLAGTHPDGSNFQVNIGEGEYLAQFQTFAGIRLIEFDVRDNEYAALRGLALQVQDFILARDADAAAPFSALLNALGVNEVDLLALCKSAAAKPSELRADYIQNYLAPLLGMKFRMEGATQALPHVSVFLDAFRLAWMKVHDKMPKTVGTDDFYARVRWKLMARYADPKEGMAAFIKTTGEFLSKTRDGPHPSYDLNLYNELQRFRAYCLQVQEMHAQAAPTKTEEMKSRQKDGRKNAARTGPTEWRVSGNDLAARAVRSANAKAGPPIAGLEPTLSRSHGPLISHKQEEKEKKGTERKPPIPAIHRSLDSSSGRSDAARQDETPPTSPRTPTTPRTPRTLRTRSSPRTQTPSRTLRTPGSPRTPRTPTPHSEVMPTPIVPAREAPKTNRNPDE
ncbi:hypothetical protein [Variovorax sp. PBL-E5]|uniref:hypothetical protein n=1 Tax=Variovorax sp. PBL-E5 TaxID=434014 RepID=UPI001318DA4D|nr:hypothetical protein [Variovorax sp. PBL-E5]VTU23266.1 hypothetical protein E5CHR_01556 [Variovorax sp. PBL-E5]